MDGITKSGFKRLKAYCKHGDQKRERACKQKYSRTDVDTVLKVGQPLLHGVITDRAGEYKRDHDQLYEFSGKIVKDCTMARAKDLSNTNFLLSLLSRERRERE